MGDSRKKLSVRLHPRDVTFLKPKGYEDWLSTMELSRATGKDIRWLHRLESANRIPKARRFDHGKLKIRLWSPAQVKEIEDILKTLKRGRPKRS